MMDRKELYLVALTLLFTNNWITIGISEGKEVTDRIMGTAETMGDIVATTATNVEHKVVDTAKTVGHKVSNVAKEAEEKTVNAYNAVADSVKFLIEGLETAGHCVYSPCPAGYYAVQKADFTSIPNGCGSHGFKVINVIISSCLYNQCIYMTLHSSM